MPQECDPELKLLDKSSGETSAKIFALLFTFSQKINWVSKNLIIYFLRVGVGGVDYNSYHQ